MNAKLIDFESKTKHLTLGNFYWTFEKALDSKTCNLILNTANNHFDKVTLIGETAAGREDENIRKGHNFFDSKQLWNEFDHIISTQGANISQLSNYNTKWIELDDNSAILHNRTRKSSIKFNSVNYKQDGE